MPLTTHIRIFASMLPNFYTFMVKKKPFDYFLIKKGFYIVSEVGKEDENHIHIEAISGLRHRLMNAWKYVCNEQ